MFLWLVKIYLVLRLIPQPDNASLLNSVIFTQYGVPAHYVAQIYVCVCVFVNSTHYELDKLDLSASSSKQLSNQVKVTSVSTQLSLLDNMV